MTINGVHRGIGNRGGGGGGGANACPSGLEGITEACPVKDGTKHIYVQGGEITYRLVQGRWITSTKQKAIHPVII